MSQITILIGSLRNENYLHQKGNIQMKIILSNIFKITLLWTSNFQPIAEREISLQIIQIIDTRKL